jgi:hypothetical protein
MSRNKGRLISIVLFFMSIQLSLYAQEEKYIGLFVYNFTKYFDWPESTKSGDFLIQVLGHKSVYDELVRLTAGKKVGNQTIVLQNINSVQEVSKSQIIFIGHWQSRFLPEILTKLGNYPIMVVTEMEGMLDNGSGINFIIRDGTIKFEMKMANLSSRQLKTDPRIRELAFRVVD